MKKPNSERYIITSNNFFHYLLFYKTPSETPLIVLKIPCQCFVYNNSPLNMEPGMVF